MTVTIKAESKIAGNEKLENISFDLVQIKEIHKRNGFTRTEVRVKNGKRDIVFGSGTYDCITVQDEETGRYIIKVKQ